MCRSVWSVRGRKEARRISKVLVQVKECHEVRLPDRHIQILEVICLLFPDRTPENKNVEGLSKRKLSGPNPGQSDKKI